jgi:hypothetical protein
MSTRHGREESSSVSRACLSYVRRTRTGLCLCPGDVLIIASGGYGQLHPVVVVEASFGCQQMGRARGALGVVEGKPRTWGKPRRHRALFGGLNLTRRAGRRRRVRRTYVIGDRIYMRRPIALLQNIFSGFRAIPSVQVAVRDPAREEHRYKRGWLRAHLLEHAPDVLPGSALMVVGGSSSPGRAACDRSGSAARVEGGESAYRSDTRALGRPQSAASPQQSLPRLISTNTANRLTCGFTLLPTQLRSTNAQEASFGTKRPWVQIPPPRLAPARLHGFGGLPSTR